MKHCLSLQKKAESVRLIFQTRLTQMAHTIIVSFRSITSRRPEWILSIVSQGHGKSTKKAGSVHTTGQHGTPFVPQGITLSLNFKELNVTNMYYARGQEFNSADGRGLYIKQKLDMERALGMSYEKWVEKTGAQLNAFCKVSELCGELEKIIKEACKRNGGLPF